MERRQIQRGGIKKLSGWFKKVTNEDDVSKKTHKVYNGVSIYKDNTKLLAAEGSGTVCLKLEKLKAFNLDLIAANALLRLSISRQSLKLYCIYRGRFILLKEQNSNEIGLEDDLDCLYWVSFEAKTRTVTFGKHEPNFHNIKFLFTLPQSNKSAEQYWMNKIGHYRIDTPAVIYSTRYTVKKEIVGSHSINLLKT
jgi:hypothetical protein